MDKLAFVKVAEVSGVVASLAENEIVKIASAEDFDAIVDAVASDLPNSYGMDDVLAKTAEVMEYLYENGYGDAMEKEAGEFDEQDALAYIGELALAKEAGEISEAEFAKEADALAQLIAGQRAPAVTKRNAAKNYVGSGQGGGWRVTPKPKNVASQFIGTGEGRGLGIASKRTPSRNVASQFIGTGEGAGLGNVAKRKLNTRLRGAGRAIGNKASAGAEALRALGQRGKGLANTRAGKAALIAGAMAAGGGLKYYSRKRRSKKD